MVDFTIGHTNDADDAFMYYGMLNGKIFMHGLEVKEELKSIAELNELAKFGHYDMTALSVAALPSVADKYEVLPVGACMALKRGPVFVTKKGFGVKTVGISGFSTSSYVAIKAFENGQNWSFCEVAFDQILPKVISGEIDGGVIISEDQLLIDDNEFEVVDLGKWWYEKFGLALPLGVDVIRCDLSLEVKSKVVALFRESIEFGLSHQLEALDYALGFGRGIERKKGEEFVLTYVNDYTLGKGEKFYEAIEFFLRKGEELEIFNSKIKVEYYYEK